MKKHFKLKNVTIGSDLELFIKDKNGDLLSAVGMFGGTKDEPKYIEEGCYIQEDNILLEANIPPVTELSEFIGYINYIKGYISKNYPDIDLHYSSSEMPGFDLLSSDGARTFGCDPVSIVDYDENGDEIPKEIYIQEAEMKSFNRLRTGGFHIHFGYDNPTKEISREIVKLFEKNVTLPLLNKDIDKHHRRSSYGKAGEYRIKPYGLECRSLGSAFLKNDDTLKEVWEGIQKTIQDFNNGERVSKQEFEIIKDIINTHE